MGGCCGSRPAINFKTVLLPQPDGSFIGADHKIELHAAETAFPRALQRVCAHRTSHTAARCVRRSHISAVRNVCPTALLIGFQEIGANDFSVVFRDKNFLAGREPIGESALPVHVARQGVSFPRADDRFQNPPDGIRIAWNRFAN